MIEHPGVFALEKVAALSASALKARGFIHE
jgi:hypothetical protein